MIINGNNIEELKKFDDNYFDSIVTDPPYEIGFMGKSWDASGIANNPEMWSECLRVLKPGGYLLSFSATRTYHRMAVAIEDSGFEIRDMIAWVYGSGFPKSHNIGKAVDKIQGNEREVVKKALGNINAMPDGRPSRSQNAWETEAKEYNITKGTSPYEGWGTALKPAHEPICMARKPLAENTVAENVLKYGTGGINIDESRVGNERVKQLTDVKAMQKFKEQDGREHKEVENRPVSYKQGRFPANLIHDNSEEVRECFPETKSGKAVVGTGKGYAENASGIASTGIIASCFADSGNASRFFKSIIYQAKASKSERGTANSHPTVKPIALMEYLIKMVTPTNGIVLDPFMGSGSTGVACVLNDFEFVGIDLDKDYCEIARARIEGVKETQTKMF
jgi:DNA modification methylase